MAWATSTKTPSAILIANSLDTEDEGQISFVTTIDWICDNNELYLLRHAASYDEEFEDTLPIGWLYIAVFTMSMSHPMHNSETRRIWNYWCLNVAKIR
jgi:hypothetical protein